MRKKKKKQTNNKIGIYLDIDKQAVIVSMMKYYLIALNCTSNLHVIRIKGENCLMRISYTLNLYGTRTKEKDFFTHKINRVKFKT